MSSAGPSLQTEALFALSTSGSAGSGTPSKPNEIWAQKRNATEPSYSRLDTTAKPEVESGDSYYFRRMKYYRGKIYRERSVYLDSLRRRKAREEIFISAVQRQKVAAVDMARSLLETTKFDDYQQSFLTARKLNETLDDYWQLAESAFPNSTSLVTILQTQMVKSVLDSWNIAKSEAVLLVVGMLGVRSDIDNEETRTCRRILMAAEFRLFHAIASETLGDSEITDNQ